MHFSTAEVNALLDNRFRSGGSDWVGLSTTVPADDVSGGITEPVGGAYARVELPRDTTSWEAAALRQISTALDVTWEQATTDWGVMQAWVLFDAATGGNAVIAGRVTGVEITTGDRPSLSAGAITILAP